MYGRHNSFSDENGPAFATTEEAFLALMRAGQRRHVARQRPASAPAGSLSSTEQVLHCVAKLYRNRRLQRDHIAVLGHYGRRNSPPDPRRRREQRAYGLWHEALAIMTPSLARRGLIDEGGTP